MKKIFVPLIFLSAMLFALPAFAQQDDEEYDNIGYYKTRGLLGVYGYLPDYISRDNKDGGAKIGLFAYYNLFSKIGGNLALGISTDYASGKFRDKKISASTKIVPVALNIAYMTASDFLNFWGGIGITYTSANINIKDAYINNKYSNSLPSKQKGLMGGDIFVGAEYIFSQSKKFGAFFEFRFSYTEKIKLNDYVPQINERLNSKVNFSKIRYTLGVSYHF